MPPTLKNRQNYNVKYVCSSHCRSKIDRLLVAIIYSPYCRKRYNTVHCDISDGARFCITCQSELR